VEKITVFSDEQDDEPVGDAEQPTMEVGERTGAVVDRSDAPVLEPAVVRSRAGRFDVGNRLLGAVSRGCCGVVFVHGHRGGRVATAARREPGGVQDGEQQPEVGVELVVEHQVQVELQVGLAGEAGRVAEDAQRGPVRQALFEVAGRCLDERPIAVIRPAATLTEQ
jgi:hypothetical protein